MQAANRQRRHDPGEGRVEDERAAAAEGASPGTPGAPRRRGPAGSPSTRTRPRGSPLKRKKVAHCAHDGDGNTEGGREAGRPVGLGTASRLRAVHTPPIAIFFRLPLDNFASEFHCGIRIFAKWRLASRKPPQSPPANHAASGNQLGLLWLAAALTGRRKHRSYIPVMEDKRPLHSISDDDLLRAPRRSHAAIPARREGPRRAHR